MTTKLRIIVKTMDKGEKLELAANLEKIVEEIRTEAQACPSSSQQLELHLLSPDPWQPPFWRN